MKVLQFSNNDSFTDQDGIKSSSSVSLDQDMCCTIIHTRSYAALRVADLDWIVGPGHSSGRYILEKKT